MGVLRAQSESVRDQVEAYNDLLKTNVQNAFRSQKKKVLDKRNLVSSLGVPLKKRDDVPATFAIRAPKARTPIRVSRPAVSAPCVLV